MTSPDANPSSNPGPVSEWEELGRGVFSSTHRRRAANNSTPPLEIFLERKGERKISVDRLSVAPLAAVVANAKRIAEKRDPPRNFYGWAVITAEKIRVAGCGVVDSPLPDNPYHAEIELPDHAVESRDAQMEYASKLAAMSQWRPCPSLP